MSDDAHPTLIIIAGPNGAGKSTFTAGLGRGTRVPIIDPDALARRFQPLAPERAAMQAGREALRQQATYLEHDTSFAVETTLAGTGVLRLMEQARGRHFTVHLVYIGIENVVTALDRIAERVAQGGHGVPSQDIRRRYERSMLHLGQAVTLAHHVLIIDNSLEQGMRVVLAVDDGEVTMRAPGMPTWVRVHLPSFCS